MNELAPQQLTSPATIDALRALVATLAPARAYTNKDAAAILDLWLGSRNENTRRSYLSSLDSIRTYFKFKTIEDLIVQLISLQQNELNAVFLKWKNENAKQKSSSWVNARLAAVRMMLKTARMLFAGAPSIEVASLKTERVRDATGCTAGEVLEALRTLYTHGEPQDYRTAALIGLFMGCGLRIGEALAIDFPEHCVLDAGQIVGIKIRGKGKRQLVTLPLPQLARESVALWMARRGQEPGPLIPAIRPWGERQGLRRWNRHMAWEKLNRLGLRRNHAVRHAFATTLFKIGVPLAEVSRAMRHSSVTTTMVYFDSAADVASNACEALDEFLRTGRKPEPKAVDLPEIVAIERLIANAEALKNLPVSSTLERGQLRSVIEALERGERLTQEDLRTRFGVRRASDLRQHARKYQDNPRVGEVLTMLNKIK